ncbi:MAG: response regulator transcription factor [Saprospiraceae bacterium]|nr:response regulator transcription factor [Bacteroidia bacterium]NNE14567.1 response regulator transcription factor [Saprospiraceae bacterium]
MIKILIADDHKVLLDGFKSLFENINDIEVVATAKNGVEVLDLLKSTEVDVVLMDINMPILNGVETCKKIKKLYPKIKVVALSMYKEVSYVKRMKAYGASAYLLKDDSSNEIIKAIYEVYDGGQYFSKQLKDLLFNNVLSDDLGVVTLTRREKEVIQLISEGLSNKEIGQKLILSTHTIDSHRKNLLAKFNAKNKAELVKKAMEKGLL